MEATTRLVEVEARETRGGNTRFVARDGEGNEYTTFREEIAARARALEGREVRITFHEQQRGPYRNVYLDEIEPVNPAGAAETGTTTEVQEAAWRTAVEAAPWLVGQPEGEVAPEQLYEKLKPFEERVAEDIEAARREQRS